MIRKIIQINKEKCNGCGACAAACHEGAIGMVNGKAELLRDDYCDGLGDCLPACPTGAITFVEREAAAYDENAVKAAQKQNKGDSLPCGCPGTNAKYIYREQKKEVASDTLTVTDNNTRTIADTDVPMATGVDMNNMVDMNNVVGTNNVVGMNTVADTKTAESQLSQWPVQIKLVPVHAPYFNGVHLLIAADCTAYAYGDFHNKFIRNRITLIGCPKLDSVDYTEKLAAIIRENDIKSVTIVRMEVPCCGGLEHAAKMALQSSGKFIPLKVVTISTDGRILAEI